MSKNDNTSGKVHSLQEFREKKLRIFHSESMKRYFQVLSIQDLIFESQELVKTINTGVVNSEVIHLSKQLLSEFTSRLSADSDGFGHALKELSKKVTKFNSQT